MDSEKSIWKKASSGIPSVGGSELRSVLILMAALAMATSPAQTKPLAPEELKPVGDWEAARAGSLCLLSHRYTDSRGKEVKILFNPDMLDRDLVIMVERGKGKWAGETDARLTVDQGTVIERASARTYQMIGDKWLTFISTSLEPRTGPDVVYAKMSREEIIADRAGPRVRLLGNTLKIEVKDQFNYAVPTPNMLAYIKVMERCTAALRSDFGVTQDDLDRMKELPIMIQSHANYKDYPTKMLRKGQQSRPLLLAWIDEDGKADDCKIVESSGHEAFDEVLCSIIIDKTEFEPARDHEGNPVRGPWLQRIIFEI